MPLRSERNFGNASAYGIEQNWHKDESAQPGSEQRGKDMAVGTAIGVGVGAATGTMGVSVAIGTAFGMGLALTTQRRKQPLGVVSVSSDD